MQYDKDQIRDFLNQLAKELRGDSDAALHDLQQRRGGLLLQPTADPTKLGGRQQLARHLQMLAPVIKTVLAQLD